MEPIALSSVALKNGLALHVLEAELAQIENRLHSILLGVGRGVPRLDFILAKPANTQHIILNSLV